MVKDQVIWGKRCIVCAAILTGLLYFDDVWATESDSEEVHFIILGPALVPEYIGSADYTAVPMLVSELAIKGIEFEIEGLRAQASLFSHNNWKSGLAVDFDMGRDSDVENVAVASMEEMDFAVNAGVFVAHESTNRFLEDDALEITLSGYGDTTGVHEGAYATLGLTYTLPLYIPWRFEFELETTFADSNYMDAYFGVSEVDAASSGLQQYEAGSSFRDITFTNHTLFFFSPKWGLFSRLSASRLLGDAADSPITEEGSEYQFFAGLGIFYRF